MKKKKKRDEDEYIKLNTKGALRSVYLCFIIGASRKASNYIHLIMYLVKESLIS